MDSNQTYSEALMSLKALRFELVELVLLLLFWKEADCMVVFVDMLSPFELALSGLNSPAWASNTWKTANNTQKILSFV